MRLGVRGDDSPSCARGPGPLEALEYHSTPPGALQPPRGENAAANWPLCPALTATLLRFPICPRARPRLRVGAAAWCQQLALHPLPNSS